MMGLQVQLTSPLELSHQLVVVEVVVGTIRMAAMEDQVVVEEQITQPHQDQRVEIDPVIHSPELLVPHHQMGGEVMVVKVDNISHTDLAVAVVPVVPVRVKTVQGQIEEEMVEQVFNYHQHSVILQAQ
tara:strand:+ start:178 stop:561 length:384 start_codon:yes stop_codon:yes gene_type:complete